MLLRQVLWNVPSQYHKVTKTEVAILEAIVEAKNGNAYTIWKASGFKHYPTVLRVLRKLKEKRLINTLDERGSRNDIVYVSTLATSLYLSIAKNDTEKIKQIIEESSSLFHDLETGKTENEKINWALGTAREIIGEAITSKKQLDVNEVIRDYVAEGLREDIINILYHEHEQKLIKAAKVSWIRELILSLIEREIADETKQIAKLKKLQKTLK